MKKLALASAAALGAVGALAGCASTSSSANDGTIAVSSTNDACQLAVAEAPAGTISFKVTNNGDQVTEFYLLGDDGLRVISEAENIGPGLSRELVAQATEGKYFASCKPGMTGDGIKVPFTVTAASGAPTANAATAELLTQATDQYQAYVRKQSAELLEDTKKFAAAYAAGDMATARALYAPTRMHWERIEPVAESFGDLDPKLDLREADLEPGQVWTGWHRAEKDLWPPKGYSKLTAKQRQKLADQLVADTTELNTRVQTLQLTPSQLGNGAKELLDEVATGKVTGEEEYWSHTDLWDFQANVEGARIAYQDLRPVIEQKDPALAAKLDAQFAALQTELDQYKRGDGFVLYTDLTPTQVKALAASVDALGESLSKLTSTAIS